MYIFFPKDFQVGEREISKKNVNESENGNFE